MENAYRPDGPDGTRGRPEEPLELDGSPVREFAFWLRDLRNRSGLTYHQLARKANYAVSTMQAAAAGHSLPTLKVTQAFVTACGGDPKLWTGYWTRLKRALDADSPSGPAAQVQPPWTTDSGTAVAREEPADSWYVESFYALLRMDTPSPEATEQRVIVAVEDGVRELATSISVPRHPDDVSKAHLLDAELLYGGSLELRDQPYESYFRHVIALASPLRTGQRHGYQLRLRLPPGQPMAPHYAYVPFCRSDHFELRVRFNADRLPADVWVLRGAPPAVIYERGRDSDCLVPDRFGEVHVAFRDLRIGHAYGVRWRECGPRRPDFDQDAPRS